MARARAKIKSTGGSGFAFEDKVAATCLIRMLDGLEAFGLAGLRVRGISFQVRASGWFVDDLLLHLSGALGETKCAVSVKSAAFLTTDGFKGEFVTDLWEQWHGASGNPFRQDLDYLALAVGRLSEAASIAWDDITERSRLAAPNDLSNQLSNKGSSSQTERSIFNSLLTAGERQKGTTPTDAARLISRMAVQNFGNRTEALAARECAAVLRIDDVAEGAALWKELVGLATQYRIAGGTIMLDKLVELLRPRHALKEHPDYRGSWDRLNKLSVANCDAVRAVAGSDTTIDLGEFVAKVGAQLKPRQVLAILGDSGVGKSSSVKSHVYQRKDELNLVWLSARQLAAENQTVLAKEIGAAVKIPQLASYSAKPVLVVADGIEQFSQPALKRLSEIITGLSATSGLDYRVLVTTQPLRWSDVSPEVYSWGAEAVETLPFSGPAFEIVSKAFLENALVRPLLFRPELKRFVTNLATLDQILKVASVQNLATDRGWVGETEVIDRIWKHWLGNDGLQHQRGALLRLLGEEDAEYGPIIPLSHIPYEATSRLGDSLIASLIKTDSVGVGFNHEVLSDWARYHVLKGEGPSGYVRVVELIRNPRWTRAIRLYSQSLLEQNEGLSAWETVFSSLGSSDSEHQLAADVFSDSLALATNSAELLERIWPALIANQGSRLRRLMKRIMIVGTIPVPTQNLDGEFADIASTTIRLPVPAYWDGLLYVLASHGDEVATHCLSEAGELCAFYLRMIPAGYGRRRTVSVLVLKLAAAAEEGLDNRHLYLRDASKNVFEALLRAGSEFPDQVSRLARSLAEREEKDESESETVKVVYSTGFSQRMFGRLLEPWPHGPLRRVEEAFREAVLETDALTALIIARPEVAAEILLAVCIEEPQREYESYRHHTVGEAGFAFWSGHLPAMYFTGPFWSFLRLSPRIALETIITLVDFATDRWLDGFRRFHGANVAPSYTLFFAGFDKTYIGDGQVFNWHREMAGRAVVVESALMATEKWLYDRLDSKEDVTENINQVLSETKSAAFLGILVAVGLYSPLLFEGPLLPLLSNPDLYLAQRATLLSASWTFLFDITWGRYGKRIGDEVRKWHEMPHRRYDFFEVARHLLFFSSKASSQLDAYRRRWEADAKEKGGTLPSSLAAYCAQLNRDNYTVVDAGEGRIGYEFHLPKDLEQELEKQRRGPELNLSAMGLIGEASRAIEKGATLATEQAQPVFQRLQGIIDSSQRDGTFELYRDDAIAAGIFLLVTADGDWLSANPEPESLCVEQLRELMANPPARRELDSPESLSDGFDLFLAEAALHLLLKGRRDDSLWVALLQGVTSYRYKTAEKVILTAYRNRHRQEIRFHELVRAAVLWAAVRGPITTQGSRFDSGIVRPHQRLVARRFVRGYFEKHPPSLAYGRQLSDRLARVLLRGTGPWEWHERRTKLVRSHEQRTKFTSSGEQTTIRIGRRDRLLRDETFFDLESLSHAFSFLGQFEGLHSQDAQQFRLYFDELLHLDLDLLPDSKHSDSFEFENQYEFDDWIMAVASLYYATLPLSEALESVANLVMSLGVGAHNWIKDFLHAFLRHAPQLCKTSQDLADRWKALIQISFDSEQWNYEKTDLKHDLVQLACEVMGFSGYPSRAADKALDGALQLLEGYVIAWCDRWLHIDDAAAAFARFISATNDRAYIELGLVKLNEQLDLYGKHARRDEDLTMSILAALQHVWKVFPEVVRATNPGSDAFHKLLSFLSALMVPEAIDLQSRVAMR